MVRTDQYVCNPHQLCYISNVQPNRQRLSGNAMPSAGEHRTLRLCFLCRRDGDQDGSNGNYWKEELSTRQVEQTRLLYRDYWVRIATVSCTQFDSLFFSQISDGEGVIGEIVGAGGGGVR